MLHLQGDQTATANLAPKEMKLHLLILHQQINCTFSFPCAHVTF